MIRIQTEHPIAADSPDHLTPYGAARDNSTWPPFNAKVQRLWPDVSLLDLGCAGGGLVASLLDEGRLAVGVEGSDYPRRATLGAWGTHPEHLFTADIKWPFTLRQGTQRELGQLMEFDVVTAWEVLEHMYELHIWQVMNNVRRHLAPGGRFMASISPRPFPPWHQTVRPESWWRSFLQSLGWELDWEMYEIMSPDWVRGPRTDPGSLVGVWRPT